MAMQCRAVASIASILVLSVAVYTHPDQILGPSKSTGCPFSNRDLKIDDSKRAGWPKVPEDYPEALAALDIDAVKADLRVLFKTSKDFWPADYGNYAPFFIRLAWHNAGSYRTSDGRGGADGAHQRFDPERSWDDNTNLDKARHLLWPIKEKYGVGLSWGDLIVLAGNTAFESMGAPILGFCGGRIDEEDGEWSQALGPTPEQQQLAPCPVNGQCERPLGSTTIGLIYLNPEGPMSQPLPDVSAAEIRDSFGRMAMNDSETVALIGGGHAFGKTHGACSAGAGPPPNMDPVNPWPGMCGTGKGADAFTSGFEGPWTERPLEWDNQYFKHLVDYDWEKFRGPGGKWMWRVVGRSSPVGPAPNGTGTQNVMRLTSDMGLKEDPTGSYQKILATFAKDQAALDHAFAHVWYKLTTRDMGPSIRCAGNDVPPTQDWQNPLPPPPPPSKLPDFDVVKAEIENLLHADHNFDVGARFVRLAWSCASTFRVTDYLGGCNGARLLQSPMKEWPSNVALDTVLTILEPIRVKVKGLSWADLIVLAGNVALEAAGAGKMSFCGGRTDASAGTAADDYLLPRVTGNFSDTLVEMQDYYKVMGLTPKEYVALFARPFDEDFMTRRGYKPTGLPTSANLTNDFFKLLLSEHWEQYCPTGQASGANCQFKAAGKELYLLKTDLLLKYDPELLAVAQSYASDSNLFLKSFRAAWTKLINSDRFGGPAGKNLCGEQRSLVKPL